MNSVYKCVDDISSGNLFKPHILYQAPSHNRNEKDPFPLHFILMHRSLFHSHELEVTLYKRNCAILVTSQYEQSKKDMCTARLLLDTVCHSRDQKVQKAFDGTINWFSCFRHFSNEKWAFRFLVNFHGLKNKRNPIQCYFQKTVLHNINFTMQR